METVEIYMPKSTVPSLVFEASIVDVSSSPSYSYGRCTHEGVDFDVIKYRKSDVWISEVLAEGVPQ